MQLTSRCNGLHRSLTRQLFEMASSYTDIINLTLGDPDLSVSPVAITAAADAMKAGKTHYSTRHISAMNRPSMPPRVTVISSSGA